MKESRITSCIRWIALTGIFLICLQLFTIKGFAEDIPVSVKALLPDNQLVEEAGYYDLLVSPGDRQDLALQLYNQSDKDITVKVEIKPAFTGDGGSFVYTKADSEIDSSLKYPLSTIATSEQNVSIPAKTTVKTKIQLAIPEEAFDGVILGAIRVTNAESEESETDSQQGGFKISNKFAYSIAIQLRENETMPKSDLVLKKAFATQVAGRNTVKVNLQNPTPTIIDDVSYEAVVTKKGSSTPLNETSVKGYRVAPNTNYNLPISWENKPFEAGTYEVQVKAKSAKTDQSWKFTQEFIITDKDAKELNDKAVDLEKDYTLYVIIGAAVLVIVLILLIILLVVLSKKRKRKAQERKKQQMRRKKRKEHEQRNKGNRNSGNKGNSGGTRDNPRPKPAARKKPRR